MWPDHLPSPTTWLDYGPLLAAVAAALSATMSWLAARRIVTFWRIDRHSEVYRAWRDVVVKAREEFDADVKLAATLDDPRPLAKKFTEAVWVYRSKIRHLRTAVLSLGPLRKALLDENEACESEVIRLLFSKVASESPADPLELEDLLTQHAHSVHSALDQHEPAQQHLRTKRRG